MGKKKPGISFERHQEIGAELTRVQHYLTSLYVELANAYSRSGPYARVLRGLIKAEDGVSTARCYAEENLFKEYPDRATTKVYYGGERERVDNP